MFNHRILLLICTLTISTLLINACGTPPNPPKPELVSGNDTWLLKSVTYPNSLETAVGDTITSKDANFKIIHAEFECPDNKSLTSLWSGIDDSALSNYSMYQRDGFTDVFITDSKGDKYLAVLIEKCGVAGLVPSDGTGFKLQFKDLEPVALDK